MKNYVVHCSCSLAEWTDLTEAVQVWKVPKCRLLHVRRSFVGLSPVYLVPLFSNWMPCTLTEDLLYRPLSELFDTSFGHKFWIKVSLKKSELVYVFNVSRKFNL